MQTALAEREPDNGERLARVHAAAERALAETRLQIGHYRDKPLDSANRVIALDCVIAEVGRDIEARFGCRVRLDLDRVDVTPRTAHELGRATCEALQNAARHGAPERSASGSTAAPVCSDCSSRTTAPASSTSPTAVRARSG